MTNNINLRFSIIVPVYNRPKEVEELLESLTKQTNKDFELVIVEDGSKVKSDDVVNKYNYVDAFGGPDSAHADFTNLQKAINYSMTSFYTTGGIRGGSEKLGKFNPRSFNMGYSKDVFESTKGFSKMRFGEDIDMSLRILRSGFETRLIKEAYVFHKRRTNLRQFFKQIYNSGIARITLYKRHPGSLKLVHFAPALFTTGTMILVLLSIIWSLYFLIPVALHILLVFIDSAIKNKSIPIGFLTIITSYIQLFRYGSGFIVAVWKRIILRRSEFTAFTRSFYK